MPICKGCTNNFPNRIIIDNKERLLHKRAYCLICSPFGTRKKCRPQQQMGVFKCNTCNANYMYNVKKKNTSYASTTRCGPCIRKEQRHKRKLKMIAYKGGSCKLCGYNKNIKALVFHHLDPHKKDFNISGNSMLAWHKIEKELDKCVLLCHNCHTEVHDGTLLIL